MGLDRYPELDPDPGAVLDAEVVVADDVLVKAFALGPGAELTPHEHPDSSNVFHVVEGTVTVVQDDEEASVSAPGVVFHDRGVVHGARNESDETAVLTATLAPFPG
ncbi:cupin domain-containing protein [Haloarchaeobius sp. TZWWS8]|uniref:cupin domain-containing protein n=1 Tax=Haloarchaeobius sp. TZWWS8 TaxID=3446121 RepID=UPI003EB785FB